MSNPLQFFDPKTARIMENSVGYQQIISTLSAVGRKVSVQKFYEIPFADYIPVVLGNGTYMRSIYNWRTFVKGEDFATGVINNAGNNARLEEVDSAYDQLSQNILNWGKSVRYNLFELQEALQANTLFSLIESRELARKKQWDLGVQKVAFMGIGAEKGLLNLSGPTIDSSNLTVRLGAMTAAQLNTFVGVMYNLYRVNCNYTAKPTHFVMPEADYNALTNFPDAAYPVKMRIQILRESWAEITGNSSFKIMPCAYCDKANYDTTNNRYALYNYDETSLKMDIPLDYTMTAAGTQNGFEWSNVAYGQFTGAIALRPLEILYFSNTAA
jgi:hypothetical protein